MPAKPLSPEQREDAERLKKAFREWQGIRASKSLKRSQDWCSEQLAFSQSAITQYLNGYIPLNPDAASKFARLIEQPVDTFSPTIAQEIAQMAMRSGSVNVTLENATVQATGTTSAIPLVPQTLGIRQLAIMLAAKMEPLGEQKRKIVAQTLTGIVMEPEDVGPMAESLASLLGEIDAEVPTQHRRAR